MIPKIVHTTWVDKNVLDSDHPMVQQGIVNFKKLHPDWDIQISDDKDIDVYLFNLLDLEDYELLKNKHVVEKSDVWRLFKMYLDGGMYIDIDRLCNKSLNEYLNEEIKWILPTCLENDFSHDIMISDKGNPVFLKALELNLTRRRQGFTSVYFLGPQTYMHAVSFIITGEIIDSSPGIEIFKRLVDKINESSFIKVVREELPYNSILYYNDGNPDDYVNLKKDFYKHFNLKHWSGEW